MFLQQLADISREEALFLPLFNPVVVYGMAERLQWKPRFDGRLRVNGMSFAP